MPFDNKFYNEGAAGLIDFIWLWYNRLSLIACFVLIVLAVVSWIAGGPPQRPPEQFVSGTNFRNLNRSRQQIQRII